MRNHHTCKYACQEVQHQKTTTNGKDERREDPYEKGHPNPNFVKKHKLTSDSHPAELFDIFVTYKTNEYNRAARQLLLGQNAQTQKQCLQMLAGVAKSTLILNPSPSRSCALTPWTLHSPGTESISQG
jgi:hypothetical protein